jgi:8-oxo-dGTP diphosphatase
MTGDGDGWVECDGGHRHWGQFGAAGLLLRTIDADGRVRVLLQHRAPWSHDGDTWGIPGGARDSHEDSVTAALREVVEETALDVTQVRVRETSVDDHGGWSYTTVLADTPEPLPVTPCRESVALRWVPEPELGSFALHPGFARTWPSFAAAPVTLVVDGANVVGARPDGWWRDRAGAAARLRERLAALHGAVLRVPATDGETGRVVVRRVVMVLEGAARAAGTAATGPVVTLSAPGSGDDTIVEVAREAADPLVVTADRGLRQRLPATARVAGPGWIYAVLED